MLLPLLYFEATEAVLLYLVSRVALKVETSRWLSSGKLVAPKEDNIHLLVFPKRQGFFLLSSAIFLCSCIRAASLFRKIRGKSYLVLEGICTGYCPKLFVKYREIYLPDAEGVPHTLFIGKDHKIRTGCSYRFYSREQRAKVMLA